MSLNVVHGPAVAHALLPAGPPFGNRCFAFFFWCTICCFFDSQNHFDSSLDQEVLQMFIAQRGFVAGCGAQQAKVNSSVCVAILFLLVSSKRKRQAV